MIEKVNPNHPDKVADRISGAIVDLGYKLNNNPKIAVEILIGHNVCNIIIESNVTYKLCDIKKIVYRITNQNNIEINLKQVPQDIYLSNNQKDTLKCGDNGIFKGIPLTHEEKELSNISRLIYDKFKTDGKYILDNNKLIICQSNADKKDIEELLKNYNYDLIINPLGFWTGGINVDSGATNRKLGSDMAQSITGGGLHGKDLSKADVSINIYAFKKAQELNKPIELSCAIGDELIDNKPYEQIVKEAKEYIDSLGGFEKFAEWGLY